MSSALVVEIFDVINADATASMPFTYALMGYALFIFVSITFALKWLKEQSFAPGYWADTFGIATLSQRLSLFALKANDSVVTGFALLIFCLANILIVIVTIGSVKLALKGKYIPK